MWVVGVEWGVKSSVTADHLWITELHQDCGGGAEAFRFCGSCRAEPLTLLENDFNFLCSDKESSELLRERKSTSRMRTKVMEEVIFLVVNRLCGMCLTRRMFVRIVYGK